MKKEKEQRDEKEANRMGSDYVDRLHGCAIKESHLRT